MATHHDEPISNVFLGPSLIRLPRLKWTRKCIQATPILGGTPVLQVTRPLTHRDTVPNKRLARSRFPVLHNNLTSSNLVMINNMVYTVLSPSALAQPLDRQPALFQALLLVYVSPRVTSLYLET